jgi:hypothetical protein
MKTVISVAVALALVLSVVPAMAGDTFRALSSMPAGEQELLTPLSDEQLATIEGEAFDTCVACSNYASQSAFVVQTNDADFSRDVYQRNSSYIRQSIYQRTGN